MLQLLGVLLSPRLPAAAQARSVPPKWHQTCWPCGPGQSRVVQNMGQDEPIQRAPSYTAPPTLQLLPKTFSCYLNAVQGKNLG